MSALHLTTTEAAAWLNVKKHTLDVWRMNGEGPQFVKMGRLVRYRLPDLEAFVAASMRQITGNPAS